MIPVDQPGTDYNDARGTINLNKKNTVSYVFLFCISFLILFALTQCEVFTNDSGEIPTIDVGISAVEAPMSVTEGDIAELSVTLENLGDRTVEDSIRVRITDNNEQNMLMEQSVVGLTPDSAQTVSYSWNTEGRSPGEYTLTAFHDFEDSNTENDSSTVSLTIREQAETDVALTAINAPSSVRQGDEVQIEVSIENTGDRAVSEAFTVTLEHLTGETTVGTQTVENMDAGGTETLVFTWDTGSARAGEHELRADHSLEDDNPDNNSITETITLNEPRENDIAITQIDAPGSATQGDNVEIEVTVENTGSFTVEEDISITLENRTEDFTIDTQSINGLEEGASETLTFTWNTDDASTGEHELEAFHTYEDDDGENNSSTASITINEPQEHDIAISGIDAPTSATLGDEIVVEVTVQNAGDLPVEEDIPVTLENRTGDFTIGTQTISGLEEGESETLTFNWETDNAAEGENELAATHSYEDENDDNNSATAIITISEPQELDIAVTDVNTASSAEQGEQLDVNVTIANTGNLDIEESINITLEDETDGVTVGTQTLDELDAGNSTTITFSWDTGESSTGEHEITAYHSFDDDNSGNDSGSTTVTINEPSIIDMGITEVDAPSSAVQGENVSVSVTFQNQGNTDITDDVDISLTNQTTDETIGEQTISFISAGASVVRTFIWDTEDAPTGTHTLVAEHDLDDDNTSNNSESTTVTLEEPGELSITGVSADPSTAVQGEVVDVQISVQNTGEQAIDNVDLFLTDQTDNTDIGSENINNLGAGNSTTVTISWNTGSASPGDHTLLASNSFNDDTGTETVTINEATAEIFITDVNASPSEVIQGQTMDIDVTVENNGTQSGEDFSVILSDQTDGVEIGTENIGNLEPGNSTTVSFTWVTDEASPGDHTLEASNSSSDDTGSETVSIIEAVTDIAVTGLNAPSSAEQGVAVDIEVTLENTGNQHVDEEIEVELRDLTDDNTINTQSINGLEAGASATLEFSWNTEDASINNHELQAQHSVNDDNAGNNTGSTTITITDPLTIDSIDPDNAEKNSTLDVTVTGTGFQQGADLFIENGSDGNGPDPEVTDVVVNNPETITATVQIPDEGPDEERLFDVRVGNPNGSEAVLENAFTVTAGSNDDD